MSKNKYKYKLKEISTSGGGGGGAASGASFTPGTGEQYATTYAFAGGKKTNKKGTKNIYYYKLGWKPVPKKIKGSGLEVKHLFEDDKLTPHQQFHNERIGAFDIIDTQLNNIYKKISNAKNKTIEYYKDNPKSYKIVAPTDFIQDYLKDINKLLS
jgi:hypothetical protein